MDVKINTLKKIVIDLTKQNKALKIKVNKLEDELILIRKYFQFFTNRPQKNNITFKTITDFINSTTQNLSIVSPFIDPYFVNLLINTLKLRNIKIQIVTSERYKIPSERPDLIDGFDRLQLHSSITHIFNSNAQQTNIIRDNRAVLLCSTNLSENDLKNTYNYIIIITDNHIIDIFKNQFLDQLPPFLRS
ncbi:MAG: phospholipase D-like domain-containing protein [Candidatus Helarchaeota archaeon]